MLVDDDHGVWNSSQDGLQVGFPRFKIRHHLPRFMCALQQARPHQTHRNTQARKHQGLHQHLCVGCL